ncbi:hypothetical protein GUITHDRAFT_145672 [Guillardia theta CCMP2712]|uniref:Uncharacterized protein n=1 Tax=Guillardia theta (strain CCMP2712) TaxID=905079 RepID=L1IKQ2_GUITC|nr:hypothetical protein GUITHDRAFT_145672 [Guillardia theta CCMP2712]EKX36504.1 hypothetical protein GUITHDRAFT_145672 [Guillardia theta CCMP2712]|eukprot:XP_005823484.1 hypothetical protein GUITHDRAFT_145672 [Guillardia theta CCMP2712]
MGWDQRKQQAGAGLMSVPLNWYRKEQQGSQGKSCSRCRRHKVSNDELSSPQVPLPARLSPRAEPETPWPLQLSVRLSTDRASHVADPSLGHLQLLAMRMSQAGYSGTSILYMFNSMGKELFQTMNDVMAFLVSLQAQAKLASTTPTPSSSPSPSPSPSPSSINHLLHSGADCTGQASAMLVEGRQAAGSWTVFWEDDYLIRKGLQVGHGLGRLLHRNPEEILSRAARCEFELPSSDLEFLCMIVDDLLRLSFPRIVRYHRICRRSTDGRLEESSLVRVTSVKHLEQERLRSTSHTMEILDAGDWDRIHADRSAWMTYMQLKSFLGEELSADELLLTHKKDMLFSEHFATLNETEEGRQKLKRIAMFIRNKFNLSSPPPSDQIETSPATNHVSEDEAVARALQQALAFSPDSYDQQIAIALQEAENTMGVELAELLSMLRAPRRYRPTRVSSSSSIIISANVNIFIIPMLLLLLLIFVIPITSFYGHDSLLSKFRFYLVLLVCPCLVLGQVDNWVHGGGFFAGLSFGFLAFRQNFESEVNKRIAETFG